MKKLLIIFLFAVTFNFFAQDQYVDSLKALVGDDVTKNVNFYYYKGRALSNAGKYNQALEYMNKILSADHVDVPMKLSTLQDVANVYLNLKDNKKALNYINQADSIYEKYKQEGKEKDLSAPYNLKSIILRRLGKYEEAINYGIKALKLAKSRKSYIQMAASNNSIGILYEKLGEYDKAEKYYLNGISLVNKDKDYSENVHYNVYGNLYMNLANSQMFQNKNDEAILNNNKALHYFNLLQNTHRISYILNNIATSKMRQKQFDSVIFYAKKSLALKMTISNKADLITNYRNLSEAFRALNNKDKALFYARKQLELLDDNIDVDNKLESLLDISKSYEINRYYFNSLVYLKQYLHLKDSFFTEKNQKIIAEIEAKYQTQQKEAEILKLSNENLKKEAELIKTKNWVYLSLGTLMLFLAGGFFWWYRRKQQTKFVLLQTAVKATEEEKQRIGKELHDSIAGSLIRLVQEVEDKDVELGDKLLKTYNEIRDLSHQLNNTPMHDEDLYDRLLEIIPEDKEGKKFILNIQPADLKLEEPYGTHVFRIVQELITNNLKHSQASITAILIEYKDNSLRLIYRDNGSLFNELKKGTGLHNIEDRVALMKGKIKYDFEVGFRLEIEIPYNLNTTQM